MINEADSIYFDDLDEIQDDEMNLQEGNELQPDDEFSNIEEPTQDNDFDLTKELLSLQGISDMNKIKFEDESGAVIEKSWNALSNNEKLMILSHQEDPDTSLDAAEIELINQIRESGLTPGQFIQNLQTSEPQPITYEVDGMSDDELFCLDLLDKVGSENITDEELQQALDNAKANPNLFSKQVASLRVYYKDLEQQRLQQEEINKQEEAEYNYNIFAKNAKIVSKR